MRVWLLSARHLTRAPSAQEHPFRAHAPASAGSHEREHVGAARARDALRRDRARRVVRLAHSAHGVHDPRSHTRRAVAHGRQRALSPHAPRPTARRDARGPTGGDRRGCSERDKRAAARKRARKRARERARSLAVTLVVAQSETVGGRVAGEGRVGRSAETGRPATRRPHRAAVLAVRGGADGDRVGAHLGAVRHESTPRGCARERRAAPALRRPSAGRRAATVPLG